MAAHICVTHHWCCLLHFGSGMWGIFYYKEIRDPKAIRNWFLSATLSVVAIIWLSRERIAAKGATATVAVNGTY